MPESSEIYTFKPHPESLYWNSDVLAYVDDRLNQVAAQIGSEQESAKKSGSTAENELYDRLLMLGAEEIFNWDYNFLDDFSKAQRAYGILAFDHFDRAEQLVFIDTLDGLRNIDSKTKELQPSFDLTTQQTQLLAQISKRVNLPYDRSQKSFSYSEVEAKRPKRITDMETPQRVTELLELANQSEDKINYILRTIATLNHKDKILLLLKLPKEDFEEFKRRRSEGFKNLAKDVTDNQEIIPDKVQRLKALSSLKYGSPTYEIDAEQRREYLEKGKNYPSSWDAEFEKT